VLVPGQLLIGDAHGVNTLAHQPQKLAAIEGIWETGARQPAVLFALPDEAAEANRMEVAIPVWSLSHPRLNGPQGPGIFRATSGYGRAGVLRVPADGRDVGNHVRAHCVGAVARLAPAAVRLAHVSARGDLVHPGRYAVTASPPY
jgi:hypothetical protein